MTAFEAAMRRDGYAAGRRGAYSLVLWEEGGTYGYHVFYARYDSPSNAQSVHGRETRLSREAAIRFAVRDAGEGRS